MKGEEDVGWRRGALRSKNGVGGVVRCIAVGLGLGLLLRAAAAAVADEGKDGARDSGGRALFVIGDSYADTGNRDPFDATLNTPWEVPYGRAWPGRPSGRFSDGRLFTDYYASYLGLFSPLPYRVLTEVYTRSTSLECGINFAFGGSGIFPTFGPKYPTIADQISQFQRLLESGIYSKQFLKSSFVLFVVAGNDYTEYNIQHPDGEGVMDFITQLISGISSSLISLYELGFENFAVTTLPPFGCFPSFTKLLNYTRCDVNKNLISSCHNILLRQTIERLRNETKAQFRILDLEKAFKLVLQARERSQLHWSSCCEGLDSGSCGEQNSQGKPFYTLCSTSDFYFFWDDVHPTHIGWKLVSEILFAL